MQNRLCLFFLILGYFHKLQREKMCFFVLHTCFGCVFSGEGKNINFQHTFNPFWQKFQAISAIEVCWNWVFFKQSLEEPSPGDVNFTPGKLMRSSKIAAWLKG